MILGNLVYMVVREVSKSDFWLNFFSTLGTFSAVGVSLYLARRDTNLRNKQEKSRDDKINNIIGVILLNACSNFALYKVEIEKQIKKNEPIIAYPVAAKFNNNGTVEPVSHAAFDKIKEYIDKNIVSDIVNAKNQMMLLTGLDINIIPIEIIKDYSEAVAKLSLFIKWLEEINEGQDELRVEELLKDFTLYYTPVKKLSEKFKT